MIGYALRRLGFYLVAAWVAVTLNFVLPRLMPGDPATALFARFQGKLEPAAVDALREALGFSAASWPEQYLDYLGHLLTGELGVSVAWFPSPVAEVIGGGLGWTLLVAGLATVIAFGLGTLLGVAAAARPGRGLDRWLPPALAFLGAFPYFWLAMLLLAVFGFGLGLAPLRHAHSAHLAPELSLVFVLDVLAHAALPVASIVLASLGGWMMSMRNAMMAALGTEAVRLAHAKGLPPRTVLWRYAARNALLPHVTGFGMALGFVLGGALLTEVVFSYPGLGYLLVQAVRNQDYPLMQGLFLLITLAVLCANWLVDVAVVALDPRARGGRR
jgi:peptide/nickel transport system permease protein